jgi:hypothetical protein
VRNLLSLFVVVAVSLLGAAGAQGDPISVAIYSGHSTNSGGGAPYSGYVGTLGASDIMFGTNTGWNWQPFGLTHYGADITGNLNVAANGTYGFTLASDDGSMLLIDGSVVVNDGGMHGTNAVTSSTFLTAGLHPFEVQFYEDFGMPGGVDLRLPEGVTYGNVVPLPGAALLGILGLGAAGYKLRRKTA